MNKILKSVSYFNVKLYFALILSIFIPTIYTMVRIYFIGQLPDTWAYSIAGQLGWINLLYEIMHEAIILPLFYFIGKVVDDKIKLSARIRSGLLFTGIVYTILSVILILFVNPLLNLMATQNEMKIAAASYIRIESVANIFSMMITFLIVVFTTIGKQKYLYVLLIFKLTLTLIFDTFFVSTLSFSLNLGVNGIAISNIITNLLALVLAIFLLNREKIMFFGSEDFDFKWFKELWKVGGISGLESFVRNIAYLFMISRMVNVVGEQGTYWVANNFIWGWLLIPVNALGEIIKSNCAKDKESIRKNTLGYFFITFIISMVWIISVPVWKPFIQNILQFSEVEKLFNLILLLSIFYIMYSFQNIFDATFYGLGKTHYMLFESVVTNTIYYGIAFILFKNEIWIPSLQNIALMFGIGIVFDSIVSLGAFIFLLTKYKINILKIT